MQGKYNELYIIDDESRNCAGSYDESVLLSFTTSTCNVDKYDGIHCNAVVDIVVLNRLPACLTTKFDFAFCFACMDAVFVTLLYVTTLPPTRSVRRANRPIVKCCASLISVVS